MRAIRGAATALLATAALCLAAPTAAAGDDDPWGEGEGEGAGAGVAEGTGDGAGHTITSFGFSVSPETVAPGGTVTLKSDGCEVPTVTVTSGVFDTVTLEEGRAGTAKVDVDAKAGAEYPVTFDCKGEKGTAPLTIAGGHQTGGQSTGGQSTGGHETGGHQTGGQSTGGGHETGGQPTGGGHETGGHTAPDVGAHKGVKAGFGGGADAMGTTEVVAGTALIAGALGAGGVLLLRRRADDRA
ncbi:hypothetical protein ACFYV5_03090 [Streptomyces sp. NPDC003035]|uniref:hypothetical protein n=1 Tax=Streptomyces sp. NPDC003035 TaxID=3364676 RepID=UPI0036B18945